jgi:hypothetical protein
VGPFLQAEPATNTNTVDVAKYQSGWALLGDEPPQTGWMPEKITIHGNQIVLRQA